MSRTRTRYTVRCGAPGVLDRLMRPRCATNTCPLRGARGSTTTGDSSSTPTLCTRHTVTDNRLQLL